MKILLVDDDDTITETINRTLLESGIPGPVRISYARSKTAALEALSIGPYDLIVCDRRIPVEDDALDAADEHGDAVCAAARDVAPGTPILVLTGFATLRQATTLLQTTRAADVFGNGVEQPMTVLVEKTDLPEALERILETAREISKLDEIELHWEGPAEDRLRRTEARVVRLYARRQNGTVGRVRPLGGGLSESRTFGVTIEAADGRVRARTVAKLGRLDRIAEEERRYHEHIVSMLNVGAYTGLAGKVDVGAGDVGGLFYTLADEYQRSLFEIARDDPDTAAEVVERLAAIFRRWTATARREMRNIGHIRRSLVTDNAMREKCAPHLGDLDWQTFERRNVNVAICSQHGDLHGHNVLVSDDDLPVLIDYGDVKTATASLDFTVLELSLLFHPTNILGFEGCPSVHQIEEWADLRLYAEGSRFRPFIAACRNSALAAAAGPREVYANAYAYAARQLKYVDTDKELAVGIIRAITRVFDEQDE